MQRTALFRVIALLTVMAALVLSPLTALAATPAPVNFALRPGGKAVIKVFAFCLDPSKKFPYNATVRPAGLADQKLRQALAYSVQQNYDQTDFRQVAFAIWYLQDNQWRNQNTDRAIAERIVNSYSGTPAPGAGQGMALQDAQAQGIVDASTKNFAPITGTQTDPTNNYFGVGTLEVVNKTNTDQRLYLAFGTTFPAPGPEFQTIMVYGTEIQSAEGPIQQLPKTGDDQLAFLPVAIGMAGLALIGTGYILRRRSLA